MFPGEHLVPGPQGDADTIFRLEEVFLFAMSVVVTV
jgi:hypothetical protein